MRVEHRRRDAHMPLIGPRSGVVGGILVRRNDGMRNVALPFMLCQVWFQGEMEIPLCHMPNLAPQNSETHL